MVGEGSHGKEYSTVLNNGKKVAIRELDVSSEDERNEILTQVFTHWWMLLLSLSFRKSGLVNVDTGICSISMSHWIINFFFLALGFGGIKFEAWKLCWNARILCGTKYASVGLWRCNSRLFTRYFAWYKMCFPLCPHFLLFFSRYLHYIRSSYNAVQEFDLFLKPQVKKVQNLVYYWTGHSDWK